MTTPTMSRREMADWMARMERLASSKPQLIHSTIEGGALNIRDGAQLTGQVGRQYDGTFGAVTLAGPTPPIPADFTATPVVGGVLVRWNGGWADDGSGRPVVAPMDFSHVEVHTTLGIDDATDTAATMRGAIISARGGDFFVPVTAANEWYVRLRARSTSGKVSYQSAVVGPVRALKAGADDIDPTLLNGTTVFYGPDDPTADPANTINLGDLWLKQVDAGPPPKYETYRRVPGTPDTWAKLADQGASDALAQAISAQQTADSKAKVFTQASKPTWSGAAGSAIWFDSDAGNAPYTWDGTDFTARLLGNGAIQPNSLVASDVVATGTVTAALLESILVLATQIIAGNASGTHAQLSSTGLRIFANDPIDLDPNEVIRLGTDTNDYLSIVDTNGNLNLSLDDSGAVNARTGNFRESLIIGGRTLHTIIQEDTPQAVGYYECHPPAISPSSNYGPIRSTVGIFEVNAYLTAGHRYEIKWKSAWEATVTPAECRYRMLYTTPDAAGSDTAPAPLTTSAELDTWIISAVYSATFQAAGGETTYTATTTGRHRFLLAIEKGAGDATSDIYVLSGFRNFATIYDTGAPRPATGQLSQGGGAFYNGSPPPPPPTPVQQYYVDLKYTGASSWRGDGTVRTDLPAGQVVQGWDPSGYNGDGKATYWFWLPDIIGTVDRVDLYLYSDWTYYNSGGTAIINISSQRGTGWGGRMKTELYVDGYPKPGVKVITLPSDWWPLLKGTGNADNDGRGSTITLGPGGGTNETYYIRFADCRLRVWYTQ